MRAAGSLLNYNNEIYKRDICEFSYYGFEMGERGTLPLAVFKVIQEDEHMGYLRD